MVGKHDPIFTCCVCGARLAVLKNREEYITKGCAVKLPDGRQLYFCPGRHSQDEVQKMIGAVPQFTTGTQYRKNLI